jgi:hypothetical protein
MTWMHGLTLLICLLPALSPAGLDEQDGKKEEMPAFELVDVVALDKVKLLGGVKRNYQIKMPEEDWESLPRLIRVDLTVLPSTGNAGGSWHSHAIYAHRNFTIEFDGRLLTCIGAVSAALYAGGETKFRTLEQTTTITQIHNHFTNPVNGRFPKASKVSPVFLLTDSAKAFRIYYKNQPIALVGNERDLKPFKGEMPVEETAIERQLRMARKSIETLRKQFDSGARRLGDDWANPYMELAKTYHKQLKIREEMWVKANRSDMITLYRDELERVRQLPKLAEARNLMARAKVPESTPTRVETAPPPAEKAQTHPAKEPKFAKDHLAEIAVLSNSKVSVAELKRGTGRLNGSSVKVSWVAKELVGRDFLCVGRKATPKYKIIVTKPGYLFVIKGSDEILSPTGLTWTETKKWVMGSYVSGIYRTPVNEGQKLELSGCELSLVADKIHVQVPD